MLKISIRRQVEKPSAWITSSVEGTILHCLETAKRGRAAQE
jgi:hypothetical protein